MLYRVLNRITSVAAVLAAICTMLMMSLTVIDVVLRNTGRGGVLGVVEYTSMLLVAAVFLGAGYGDRIGVHVSTQILTSRLRPRRANLVRLFGAVCTALFLAYLTYACAVRAAQSVSAGEFRYGLTQVPVWPARVAIAVGLALFTLERITSLIRLVRDLRSPDRTPPTVDSGTDGATSAAAV